MKPVTDLVLSQSLELIPIDSLPKQRSEELVSLQHGRSQALGNIVANSLICFASVFTVGIFGFTLFMAFLGHASFVMSLFILMLFIIMFTVSVFASRTLVDDVRAYLQMTIPPQLKIDAEAEKMLLDTAQRTNEQATNWNTAAKEAVGHDVGDRFLQSLKTSRDVLSARATKIKSLATRAGGK